MSKKKKMSAFQKLRQKERERRLVPEVVIRRRRNQRSGFRDPAVPVIAKAKSYSKKHAKHLHDLTLRSMGLIQSHEALKEKFEDQGLDDLGLDPRAKALISNAVNKVSEILIFKMVAAELVNDKALADHLVELFINQRFDAMRSVAPSPPAGNTPAPAGSDSVSSREKVLTQALAIAMGLENK